MTMIAVLFLTMSAIFLGTTFGANKSRTIHFGAFVPSFGNDKFGYKAAIEMAVNQINNRTDFLEDYKIVVHYVDTYAHPSVGVDGLYRFLNEKPTKIALLGPAYSSVTYPVVLGATINALIQVTYAALLPKLLDKGRYPYFFRSTPSMLSFNKAKIALLKEFKWNRVGLIYDYKDSLFFETIDDLQKNLKKQNFNVVSIEGFSSDFGATAVQEVRRLKKLDARIIIAELSKFGAISVFCEAYKNKMYGSKYVWIVTGSLYDDWYKDTTGRYNACTPAQLKIASQGYIYVTRLDLRTDGKRSVSGMSSPEFFANLTTVKSSASTYASFAFDAVWILAKTFSEAAKSYNLSEWTYKNFAKGYSFLKIARKLDFEGISGPVKFDFDGERMGHVLIRQVRNGIRHDVARHSSQNNNITFYPGTREELFFGKPAPLDHAVVMHVAKSLPISVISVMWSLAILGLIVSTFFLYFNIRYRKNRLIKMSSPMINNVIIIGSMLCYIAVLFFGLDTRLIEKSCMPYLCNMFVWILTIGFTLSFGALFSKTWRVYKIFTAAKTMERVAIQDRHLFGIIILFLGVDVAILVVWTIISPYSLAVTEVSRVENLVRDIIEVTEVYHCSANFALHFSSSILAYKGIILLLGLFLAWETRNVEVPALNDSKFIGMAVYNVAALSAIGVTCTYALSSSESSQAGYTVVCLCIILCNTVSVCLVFVPKLYLLFSKDPGLATDVSRISMDKCRALSTLSASGTAKKDLFGNSTNGTLKFSSRTIPVRKITASSMASSVETILDSFDAKAWSVSMTELTESSKKDELLNISLHDSVSQTDIRDRKDSSVQSSVSDKEPFHGDVKSDLLNQDAVTELGSDATSRVSLESPQGLNANRKLSGQEPEVKQDEKTPMSDPVEDGVLTKLPNGISFDNELYTVYPDGSTDVVIIPKNEVKDSEKGTSIKSNTHDHISNGDCIADQNNAAT